MRALIIEDDVALARGLAPPSLPSPAARAGCGRRGAHLRQHGLGWHDAARRHVRVVSIEHGLKLGLRRRRRAVRFGVLGLIVASAVHHLLLPNCSRPRHQGAD